MLRIWPLYYALLAFMFLIVPKLRPQMAHRIFGESAPWWAYALFLQNFAMHAATTAAGSLGVTWSLAIEEQFYLIWPWIVRFASRLALVGIAVAVVVLSPLIRHFLSLAGVDLYTNVFCRLDGLMEGALLAALTRTSLIDKRRFIPIGWAGLVLFGSLAIYGDAVRAPWDVFSLSALASACLVFLVLSSQNSYFDLIFSNRFIAGTGTISYGLYLLHKIPFDVVKGMPLDRYSVLAMPLLLGACYLLAWLSWRFLEQPFLVLKRHWPLDRERPGDFSDPVAVLSS
jgi:peptidoglycan/LPS O-acetylase OafA/YrhL